MKAVTSMDPSLVRLLGRKLYTEDPVTIAVRELGQNSVDACIRAGVDPQITIEINHNSSTHVTRVVCTDDGCGMTEEELVQYFLRSGSSSKSGAETGRFGVGAVVILTASYWHVRTLDNEVDAGTIMEGGDIVKCSETLQGTVVTAEYEDSKAWSWESRAICMMAFSSVKTRMIIVKDGRTTMDEVVGLDPDCGFAEMTRMPEWVGYGLPCQEVGGQKYGARAFVRLNGLVQFEYILYGNEMEGNIIIDVTSSKNPDDKDFPMVMSREKLSGPVEREVSRWTQELVRNASTTDTVIRRSLETEDIKFSAGRILTGKRNPNGFIEKQLEDVVGGEQRISAVKDWIRDVSYWGAVDSAGIAEFVDPTSQHPIMRLINYNPSAEELERDSRFIVVWGLILEQLMIEGFKFGVGLISDPHMWAETLRVEGVTFISVNPHMIPVIKPVEAQILNIWQLAIHEVAHVGESDHNEKLTSLMQYLTATTSPAIWKYMSFFSKLLLEG